MAERKRVTMKEDRKKRFRLGREELIGATIEDPDGTIIYPKKSSKKS